MEDRVLDLNKEQKEPVGKEEIRDIIGEQQELHKKIKEQINIQIEKCHVLLNELK